MIQFNLLPDIKLVHIKTKRTQRLAILLSVGITGALVAVTILLFLVVNVFQKGHLNDLNTDIKKNISELENTPDINKILTIQNQLNSLPALHDSKPVASRLFPYLTQITPDNQAIGEKITIASVDLDFEAATMSIKGGADNISIINKFVDTLKFTKYVAGSDPAESKAFSAVVLTSFGKDEQGATYAIDFKFDPLIFNSAQDIKLVVPRITTTRSETEKPTDLFQPGGSGQIDEEKEE